MAQMFWCFFFFFQNAFSHSHSVKNVSLSVLLSFDIYEILALVKLHKFRGQLLTLWNTAYWKSQSVQKWLNKSFA